MKRLIFFSLFLCDLCLVQARQQTKLPTIEELAKKNVDEIEIRLKLNPTQKSVIYNYAFDLAKELLAIIKKQQSGTFKNEDDMMYYRLQNEFNAKVKTVLKPEQVTEFNRLIEDRLNGIESKKKKKKRKKNEEEEAVIGIEGLKSAPPPGNM